MLLSPTSLPMDPFAAMRQPGLSDWQQIVDLATWQVDQTEQPQVPEAPTAAYKESRSWLPRQ